MVVSGAIAAAFALPGCAPQGYDAADYGANAAPAAEAAGNVVEAEPTPTAGAGDDPAAEDTGADAEKAAPEVPAEDLTTELVAKKIPRMGEAVVDQDGMVLYRFDKDKIDPAKSNCNGECEKIWPAALTDGEPELDGVSSDDVGTVKRADGTTQITIGGWPAYRYIGDKKPGQWAGQNVGATWFVMKPDGTKNLTCLPPVSKPVKPPADDKEEADKAKGNDSATEYSY